MIRQTGRANRVLFSPFMVDIIVYRHFFRGLIEETVTALVLSS
jgi:hypothetical protein